LEGQNHPPDSRNHVEGYDAGAVDDDKDMDGAEKLPEDWNTNAEENFEENIAGAEPSAYDTVTMHHTNIDSRPTPTTSDIGVQEEPKESRRAPRQENIQPYHHRVYIAHKPNDDDELAGVAQEDQELHRRATNPTDSVGSDEDDQIPRRMHHRGSII